jgi:uncharacterized protein (UPF0332 family)
MSPDDLIAVARLLSVRTSAKDPAKQALIRRSIPTAYYAAFHAVLRAAADQFAGGQYNQSAFYVRVYRSPDHKDLKNLCKRIAADPKAWAAQQGLPPISSELTEVAKNISELYEERIEADYDPKPTKFAWSKAVYAIERAQHVIAEFSLPMTEEKACFLVAVAFKPAPR